MPFACLHVPDFPVQAVVRNCNAIAGLREKAIAVLEGAPPIVTVIAANEKARNVGITAGMTKLQAEACSEVTLVRRSLAQEESAHSALLDCGQTFSPRVESTAPDTVILDLQGLEQLFGPAQNIACELSRHAVGMGMETNVAVASNPDAAMHAALGFPGVTVIPCGKEAERLGCLPIDVLGASEEMLETLDRWGVRDLRSLAALPPLALSERLGQEGLRLQALALGKTSRSIVPAEPQLHFEESMELEDAVDLLEPLAFILSRLLEQLCTRLAARALSTNELRMRLELEVHEDVQVQHSAVSTQHSVVNGEAFRKNKRGCARDDVHERVIRLPVPMRDSKVFLKLLQLDLQSSPPSWPVKQITLVAEAARARAAQGGLFVPASPEPERMELTLARIRNVVQGLGKKPSRQKTEPANVNVAERVGSPVLVETHKPDAFLMRHFTTETERAQPRSAAAHVTNAVRMFRPALPVRVELRNGAPARLLLNKSRVSAEVVAFAGPWRNSGEWWGDQAWSREEWDVAVRQAKADVMFYRVCRDLNSGEWFLEGSYD
jgi:protein ImuB